MVDVTKIPKFFSSDIENVCVIYALKSSDEHMSYTSCLYVAVAKVTTSGSDAILEQDDSISDSMFIHITDHTVLPETYGDRELIWYPSEGEDGNPLTLDDLLVLASF